MAVHVPDTNTFSLEDVYDAVNDHANPANNLDDCFTKALSGYFDSDYDNNSYAPANSMKRFRNYGPQGNPQTGSYTLPFDDYNGYRAVGLLICVPEGGGNLYVLLQVRYPTYIYQLVQFSIDGYDASTAVYVGERNIGVPTAGNTFKSLRFSKSGDRFMLLEDTHLTSKNHSGKIRTWTLATNWNVTSADSYYETDLIPYYDDLYPYFFDGMDFTEDGYTLVLFTKWGINQYLDFFTLSTPTIPPSGTINSGYKTQYCDQDIDNTILGFNVFEESFTPGQTGLGVVAGNGDFAQVTIRIDENPWMAYYSYTTQYTLNPYNAYADSYTTSEMIYTFVLEYNTNASDPLNPRIYLKINP